MKHEQQAEQEGLVAVEEAKAFFEEMKAMVGDDSDLAREICVEAKKERTKLDDKRKFLKAPSLETSRRIDGFFMPAIRTYDDIIGYAKGVIQRGIEKKRAEKKAALEAAKTSEEVVAVVQTKVKPEGVTTRKTKRVRVTDWRKVPEPLLILDHRAAVEMVRAGDDISEWGEVYYDETVTV